MISVGLKTLKSDGMITIKTEGQIRTDKIELGKLRDTSRCEWKEWKCSVEKKVRGSERMKEWMNEWVRVYMCVGMYVREFGRDGA